MGERRLRVGEAQRSDPRPSRDVELSLPSTEGLAAKPDRAGKAHLNFRRHDPGPRQHVMMLVHAQPTRPCDCFERTRRRRSWIFFDGHSHLKGNSRKTRGALRLTHAPFTSTHTYQLICTVQA